MPDKEQARVPNISRDVILTQPRRIAVIDARNFSLLAAAIFTAMAARQLMRAISQWPVMIATTPIPLWSSWIAFVVFIALAWLGFRAYRA